MLILKCDNQNQTAERNNTEHAHDIKLQQHLQLTFYVDIYFLAEDSIIFIGCNTLIRACISRQICFHDHQGVIWHLNHLILNQSHQISIFIPKHLGYGLACCVASQFDPSSFSYGSLLWLGNYYWFLP